MTDEIKNLYDCMNYIRRQWAYGKSDLTLRVGKRARNKIKKDLEALAVIKDSARPTYGPPYGDIDRLLWDEHQALKKLAQIRVLGVLIEE
jgi:hypothetical protein